MLGLIAPLLSLLGIEASAITDRIRRQAMVWGLIGAFGMVFVVFLLVAANAALSQVFGPVVAPLLIAVAAAVLAVAVFLVFQLMNAREARREAERQHNAEVASLVTTALITAVPLLLRSPLFRNAALPAGAALASALLLLRSGRKSQQ